MSNKKMKTSEVEFEYTSSTEYEDVPKDVTIVRFHSSVTEVDAGVFKGCEQLKKAVLNEGLKKIGNYSFISCISLEYINLPSSLIEIGNNAFNYCRSLRELMLNETLQKIGKAAFANCTSLEIITTPPTITEISERTFYNCQNLREVGLHEGTLKIRPRAFEDCLSLERFTFPNLSARLNTIVRAGQTEVEDKIEEIRGNLVERRGSEVLVSAAHILFSNEWNENDTRSSNWNRLRGVLGRIERLLTYYELKEATTLLELAMWKSKIDQAQVEHINRDKYRIDIPGPVQDTILQYLNFRV